MAESHTATTDYEALRAAHAGQPIPATMMGTPMRVTDILRRAEQLFGWQTVASRTGPGEVAHMSYAELGQQARRLGAALKALGVRPGQRVATLMWNHAQHLTCYYGVPAAEAVLHPLNPRLAPEELAYVIADAGDDVVILDAEFLPLWSRVAALVQPRHVIVNGAAPGETDLPGFAELLAGHDPLGQWPDGPFDETSAATICYTSGTTGHPRGVVYSHRSICMHAISSGMPDSYDLGVNSVAFPLTPMFHVNAWGIPYSAVLAGAAIVLPGAHVKADEMLDIAEAEGVSLALGVPTIWTDVLHALEAHPGRWKLREGLMFAVGGSAPPPELFRGFDRFGIHLKAGWGMTETSPIASQAMALPGHAALDAAERMALRASQGIPQPFIEFRIVDPGGTALPWDGAARGELQVRGPWVSGSYIGHPEPLKATTEDGWLRTGDVAIIRPDGYVKLVDRLKDLIKSGGEWISSVDMESCIAELPQVAEVAVIALTDERWGERPLAVVRARDGAALSSAEVRDHLLGHFPRWMVPERIELVPELPRTGTGKLSKLRLRQIYNPDA